MNKKIAIDVDGVLLDFYTHLLKKDNIEHKMKSLDVWTTDEINEMYYKIKDDKEFWSYLPPLSPPNSITFDFECYLTSIPPNMERERLFNLLLHGFPLKNVYVSHNKADYCLENDIDILIDDKVDTIIDCRNKGINGIFFKPYYYSDEYGKGLNPIRSLMEAPTQFNNTY